MANRPDQRINDVHSLVTDLKSCSLRKDLQWGRKIHAKAVDSGNGSNMYVEAALIKMYAKCGSMVDAHQVFDRIKTPDVVSWTALFLGYAENGQGRVSLELFSRMKYHGGLPDSVSYIAALKACTSLGDRNAGLETGCRIHLEIGGHLNLYVQNTLISMYAKCGSMLDAHHVFDSIRKPNVVSWNALLLGYAENGQGHATLELFSKMKAEGCAPDSATYVAALKACTSLAENGAKAYGLEMGSCIHSEIHDHLNLYVQSTLVDMYAKCGSMLDARQVFNRIQKPDIVSWNALLLGYAENGEGNVTLELFSKMKRNGFSPNSVTYVAALKSCTSLAMNDDCLEACSDIHLEIGDHMNRYVQSMLIDVYAKLGCMSKAREVFDNTYSPDVVSWNALLLGYAENGEEHVALELFSRMKDNRCAPDSVTYMAALKACGSIGALSLGREFHTEMSEFTARVAKLVTCLVDFYAKCASMVEARAVFERHSDGRDTKTWTVLLAGYSSCGDVASVFSLFETMQELGFRPDSVTFVCVLLCCSHAGLVEKARQYLEAMPLQFGIVPEVCHYSCMVDVLGRANQLTEVVSVLREMPCNPNAVTWTAFLGACRKWKNVKMGSMAFQSLMEMDNKDSSGYLVMAHIYGSLGMLEEQTRILERRTNYVSPEEAHVADDMGKIRKFVSGEEDPPEVENKLAELLQGMKEHRSAESFKGGKLCGHTGRRAVVYGILKTPSGEAVRVFTSTRMCDGCHESTKLFSKLSRRVILVRDASKFHVMENGSCSCGDYF